MIHAGPRERVRSMRGLFNKGHHDNQAVHTFRGNMSTPLVDLVVACADYSDMLHGVGSEAMSVVLLRSVRMSVATDGAVRQRVGSQIDVCGRALANQHRDREPFGPAARDALSEQLARVECLLVEIGLPLICMWHYMAHASPSKTAREASSRLDNDTRPRDKRGTNVVELVSRIYDCCVSPPVVGARSRKAVLHAWTIGVLGAVIDVSREVASFVCAEVDAMALATTRDDRAASEYACGDVSDLAHVVFASLDRLATGVFAIGAATSIGAPKGADCARLDDAFAKADAVDVFPVLGRNAFCVYATSLCPSVGMLRGVFTDPFGAALRSHYAVRPCVLRARGPAVPGFARHIYDTMCESGWDMGVEAAGAAHGFMSTSIIVDDDDEWLTSSSVRFTGSPDSPPRFDDGRTKNDMSKGAPPRFKVQHANFDAYVCEPHDYNRILFPSAYESIFYAWSMSVSVEWLHAVAESSHECVARPTIGCDAVLAWLMPELGRVTDARARATFATVVFLFSSYAISLSATTEYRLSRAIRNVAGRLGRLGANTDADVSLVARLVGYFLVQHGGPDGVVATVDRCLAESVGRSFPWPGACPLAMSLPATRFAWFVEECAASCMLRMSVVCAIPLERDFERRMFVSDSCVVCRLAANSLNHTAFTDALS